MSTPERLPSLSASGKLKVMSTPSYKEAVARYFKHFPEPGQHLSQTHGENLVLMKEEEGKPDAEVFTKGCITLVGVGGHIEHARVGAVHADTSLTQARAQAYVDRILAHGRDDPKIRFSIIGLLPEGKTGMRDKIVGFFVKALENRGHTIHPDDIVRLHSEHGGFMTRIRPRGEITVFVHAEKNQ